MRIGLDTNTYSDAARGEARAVELLRRAREIWLPFVVIGELRAGFASGLAGRRNEAHLARFLSSGRVHVAWADEGTTHLYARLFSDLRAQGTPIPTNDLWIAALVLQHDLVLFTRDEHFCRLPQLARL